jgi:hypothetical protein
MKAITIKQPWASLIVEGIKPIENRTWNTNFRGRVLVHAAAKPANIKYEIEGQASIKEIQMFSALGRAEEDDLFGCIIGSVEIVDCVINHPSIWAEKSYRIYDGVHNNDYRTIHNWVLANPIKFPEPIPMKGKLSFWESECKILKCPQCGEYCMHYNHDVGVPNWGNPVHICGHCGYSILESEFEYL